MESTVEETESQIRDLLVHLNPMIHFAGSSENTFEMLLYLAEMDPTFHKLELVQSIRKELREKMEEKVDSYVRTYLEEHAGKMRGENPLDYLTDQVCQDKAFLDFRSNFEDLLEKSVNSMSDINEEESFKNMMGDGQFSKLSKSSPVNSAETSLNSSLNQSGFLFLHPSQYSNIATSLQKKQQHSNVIDALNLLLAVTPGEPVTQEIWPTIRKSLKECLQSSKEDIFYRALKFHVRLLTSQSQIAVKEGFLNMLEALTGFWLSKKLIQRVMSQNSSRISIEDNNILQLAKILTEFLKEFPMLWTRYPAEYVSEMIEALFSTFAVHLNKKDDERMAFLDVICLIDPKASWFVSWTHGQFGRKKTMDGLSSKSSLLSHSVFYCITYVDKKHEAVFQGSSDHIHHELFEFYKFSHSLKLVLSVIKYARGRELFPVYDHHTETWVSVKKIMLTLGNAAQSPSQRVITQLILKSFYDFCYLKESLGRILCEVGLIDSLIRTVSSLENIVKSSDFKIWYVRSVLLFFFAANSTSVGHEYLLTGKVQKGVTKTSLTTNVQTPAQILFSFTKAILPKRWVSSQVKEFAVNLSCSLLKSPLGRHLFISHPLTEGLLHFLQEAYRIKFNDLISVPIQVSPNSRPFSLEYVHAKQFVETLIMSHKGILILERNSVLLPVLDLALPELARKGQISCKLLNRLITSEQGCYALGKHFVVKPYWDMVKHIAAPEAIMEVPLLSDNPNEVLEEALFPLLCLASTFQGIKLIYGKFGLQEEMQHYLFDASQQETELYSVALKVLGMATSNLDGLLYLQSLWNLQENLLGHQSPLAEAGAVIVDENSVMRSHILLTSFVSKDSAKFVPQPFVMDIEPNDEVRLIRNLPPPYADKSEKVLKGAMKKQSELWKFLSDTRNGLHDSAWLTHCRKAYRTELSTSDEVKLSTLMEMMELALETLINTADEVMPGISPSTIAASEDIPSPISTSFSNSVFCYPLNSSPRSEEDQTPKSDLNSPTNSLNEAYVMSASSSVPEIIPDIAKSTHNSFAVDLIIRYGKEHGLISDNESQRSNLIRLNLAVESYLMESKTSRFDWFPCLIYFLSGGSVDRTFSTLRKLKGVKIGSIIWPSLTSSLSITHQVLPKEILFSCIIHLTKLVLFRDSPSAFLAVEELGDGILWNLLSEWISQSFIGVLPWPENLHMLLVPLLHGTDYFVYSLAALMLHVQKWLTKFTSETRYKKVMFLQTDVIHDWRIQDHFTQMDSLSKRFRKVVVAALNQPLHSLRYEYIPKQL